MTKPVFMASISTYISADTPEQAALLFQDMFQDAEHPGWGIRVVDTKTDTTDFIDTELLADRRDEIMGEGEDWDQMDTDMEEEAEERAMHRSIMGDEALDTDPL